MKRKHMKKGLVLIVAVLAVLSTSMVAVGTIINDASEIRTLNNSPPEMRMLRLNPDHHAWNPNIGKGQMVYMEACAYDANGGKLKFYYDWDWNERIEDRNSYDETVISLLIADHGGTTCRTLEHRYKEGGSYKVKVYCRDEEGNGERSSNSYTYTVNVAPFKSRSLDNLQFDILNRFPLLARLLKLTVFDNLLVFQR